VSENWKIIALIPVIVGLFALEQHLKNGIHTPPQSERSLALGETHARELLRLIGNEVTGKVSRQEFMAFMDAEYKRLDKNSVSHRGLTASAKTSSR
jgi:hypothetical protein